MIKALSDKQYNLTRDDEAMCLNNKNREHMIAFKYLGNGPIYIALRSEVF